MGRLDAYPPGVYAELFGLDTEHPDTVVGDISDRALMRHTAQKSDYVIHAAAMADVAACTRNPLAAAETHITGTQVLLEEVVRTGRVRRLVFTSSAAVYGNGHGSPGEPVVFRETHTPAPLSVYGNTKLWLEHITGGTLLEQRRDVQAYSKAWDELTAAALSPSASQQYIRDLSEESGP